MDPVNVISGKVSVLDRADVDTDQIMPKQFLKRIERTGYGEFLFFDWRKDPGFELNRPEAAGLAHAEAMGIPEAARVPSPVPLRC